MDEVPNGRLENKGNSLALLPSFVTAAISRIRLRWGTTLTVITLAGLSVGFWFFLSRTTWSPALFVSLSLASFMVGCTAGFLFTSYGDEAATVGKVRDWLIGGLTGLTIAKFGALKSLLLTFASGPGPQAYALTVGVSITFAVLGFFAMFFQRELILNVLLAESRDRRGRVEGTKAAGIITHQLLSFMPPSLLAGIDDIDDDLASSQKPETQRLRNLLKCDEVKQFLIQAEQASMNGSLDWDVVSKAAILHYYLIYFTDADEKEVQEQKAFDWITKALMMNPGHSDFTAKYADVLAMMNQYNEAIETLERLDKSTECPAYVRQWLGYWLLYIPKRQDDSIRYSEEYHNRFPDETDSLYNIARAYAQKFAEASRRVELEPNSDRTAESDNLKRQTLSSIKRCIDAEPASEIEDSRKWFRENDDFTILASDSEFDILVGISPTAGLTAAQK